MSKRKHRGDKEDGWQSSNKVFTGEEQPTEKPYEDAWKPDPYCYLGDWARDGKLHNPPTGAQAWIAGYEPWNLEPKEKNK